MSAHFFAVVLACCGCASNRAALSSKYEGNALPEPRVSKFGTIALSLLEPSRPATIGFQKAKGRKGTVKEAIWDSAELGLSGPGAGIIVAGELISAGPYGGDPLGEGAIVAAAAGVTTIGAMLIGPAVGAEGLIRSMQKVGPAELAQGEANVITSLNQIAQQEVFQNALLQIGAERIPGGFLSTPPVNSSGQGAAMCTLQVRVNDVRLERAGSGEGSYVLRISTHASLVRMTDGITCFEQNAEYRSDKALFLDWTLHGAIEGVAETGYQTLASYYVSKLFP